MRRTASILTAVAIVLMAYAPVYAAGQAAEDHLCCLQQLRQETAQAKPHCDGMSAHEAPSPASASRQLWAANHHCERCVAAASVHASPLSSAATGFVIDQVSETLAHSQTPAHSDAGLQSISGRGPPSTLAA